MRYGNTVLGAILTKMVLIDCGCQTGDTRYSIEVPRKPSASGPVYYHNQHVAPASLSFHLTVTKV